MTKCGHCGVEFPEKSFEWARFQVIRTEKPIPPSEMTQLNYVRSWHPVLRTFEHGWLCAVCADMFNAIIDKPHLSMAHLAWSAENKAAAYAKRKLLEGGDGIFQ